MNPKAYKKGSLTVETAMILPVFMTALLALVSILLMYLAGQRMQMQLINTAEDLAVKCSDGHNEALSAIRDDFVDSIPEEDLRFIQNGKDGIDMSGSDLDDPEYIVLSVRCDLVPLTGSFGVLSVPYSRKCLTHIWCGYERGYYPDDEYVYITNDSEVYHRDRECSHILLSVKEVSPNQVGSLRNMNGGRYRACEICHARLTGGRIYITDDGDRYHNSITCSGLKRTVYAVRLSEVGDKRPCSRCGR
ncbi:MAG: pilus assembly protein [Lachnospiraceae bacterium]|nr:pilus assembly protein [Lachnospiraceae bacterium]